MPVEGHRIRASDPLSLAVEARDRNAIDLVEDALANDRILLAFQPIVQSTQTDRPAYYEGLVRACDASGRIIPAKDFIDAVETTELGRKLDVAALRLGLQTLADQPDIRLSINMSARSIGYKPWTRVLHRGLRRDPTIGERLILEITERSAIIMPDIVTSFMSELQDMGISFALDDFGSGYTSLSYLRDFYFDILKIDGQYIRGISRSPDNQALVKAVISLAQHFDMLTVAEFVESEEDAEALAAFGVDCMQGYYFGMPTVRPVWMIEEQARAQG